WFLPQRAQRAQRVQRKTGGRLQERFFSFVLIRVFRVDSRLNLHLCLSCVNLWRIVLRSFVSFVVKVLLLFLPFNYPLTNFSSPVASVLVDGDCSAVQVSISCVAIAERYAEHSWRH